MSLELTNKIGGKLTIRRYIFQNQFALKKMWIDGMSYQSLADKISEVTSTTVAKSTVYDVLSELITDDEKIERYRRELKNNNPKSYV